MQTATIPRMLGRASLGNGFRLVIGCLLGLLTTDPVCAQQPPPDLGSMTIEDLMNLTVTSAGRKEQKLSSAATAVYVITQEEIRRSGATSLPDVLRLAPGVQVAQISSNSWAVSIRGTSSKYSNKLLVLVDGRTVYSPVFSGVYWNIQDMLLEDIERIEVVRGPGATLWGTNAVNGVINIITKPADETRGTLVGVGGGNYDSGFGYVRQGARAGKNGNYRTFLQYGHHQELIATSGTGAGDSWGLLHGGVRGDWLFSNRDTLTIQGDLYRQNADQLYRVVAPSFPYSAMVPGQERASGGNALLRWTRQFKPNSEAAWQVYYDRMTDDAGGYLRQTVDTVDVDFQHLVRAGQRHDVVWGGGFRFARVQTAGSPQIALAPADRNLITFSGFVQDEMALAPERLFLTLGTKVESNVYTGPEVQPSVRLLWAPTRRQAAWAAASRAIRSPSPFETSIQLNMAAFPVGPGMTEVIRMVGNPGMRSEELIAYEAGYRAEPHSRIDVDAAGFFHRYHRLSSCAAGTPILSPGTLTLPYVLGNGLDGRSYGLEAAATYKAFARWKLSGSYSWLHARTVYSPTHPQTRAFVDLGFDPEHLFQAHSYLSLPHNLEFDTNVYFVGAQQAGPVDRYTRVDLRVAWQPTRQWEWSFTGQNLLRPQHSEFLYWDQGTPEQVGRSFYGKVVWRF